MLTSAAYTADTKALPSHAKSIAARVWTAVGLILSQQLEPVSHADATGGVRTHPMESAVRETGPFHAVIAPFILPADHLWPTVDLAARRLWRYLLALRVTDIRMSPEPLAV
jgi:hypothetical protein